MGSAPTSLPKQPHRRHRLLYWFAVAALLVVIALATTLEILARRAVPILKGRVIDTLQARFHARVELDSLDVSVLRGLEVSGHGLRIAPPDDVVAAGATHPIISVDHFSFFANLRALWVRPVRVDTVYVTGLEIHIPPRQMRAAGMVSERRKHERVEILVDHFVCQDSHLVLDNGNPAKEPKRFELKRIELWHIGPEAPWRYDATLTNAIPRGNIHATGGFGPWNYESPGDAFINGRYTFDHADLSTINGISGTLASVGNFRGQLNRIDVTGTTQTPDFALDSANHPMPLNTVFHAIVDGTTGDTTLESVDARLRATPIHCSGSVVNLRGQGHVTDLDVTIANGRLEDLLALAVKTRPVYLTAAINTQAKLHIPPGRESIARKLNVTGSFTLRSMHFTNPKVQDKVDDLSLRARGRPAEAKPGAPQVSGQMTGNFALAGGRINFQKLDYTLPGAQVHLAGVYSLSGEEFDFRGTVKTQAEVSQMVSSWWKQMLLKPVDRFFRKDGAGTEIPVKISGTHNEPHFGLDFHDKSETRNTGSHR